MGYKHSREDILQEAVAEAVDNGIGQLSFGRVAKRIGISDRTIVYYFQNKETLIAAVLEAQSAHINALLGAAFSRPAKDHTELLRTAWPVLATEEADPSLRLFLEMLVLCVRRVSPFDTIVPPAIDAWVELIMQLLEGPESKRRAEAEATLALVDGLLLFRQVAGPEVADRAARLLMKTTKAKRPSRT